MNRSVCCPMCHGAGFLRREVPFGHPLFGKAFACECTEQERTRKRREQLLARSNLGLFPQHRFATFQSRRPGVQEAFREAVQFASRPVGWLLLVGPNGCGKTHLGVAIAHQCLEAGAVVLFATVPDLLDQLRATFDPGAQDDYTHLFAQMREAEVVILDDLGTQQQSPWATEKLFQLLNYRYHAALPTVLTANPEGRETLDARLRSRLGDHGLVTVVAMEQAGDYRPFTKR